MLMRRSSRRAWLLGGWLVVLAAGASAHAQESVTPGAAPGAALDPTAERSLPSTPAEVATPEVLPLDGNPSPTRFYLEAIAVEGTTRESAKRIVVSQSRLVPGREYGEGEIRDAIKNVKRLPFVLGAEARLRRGSERGRYILVLDIEETSRAYLELSGSRDRRVLGAPGLSGEISASLRQFAGEADMFSLAASLGATSGGHPGEGAELGYSRYDAFGPSSLFAFRARVGRSHGYRSGEVTARAALPLGRVQVLSLAASLSAISSSEQDGQDDFAMRRASVVGRWSSDTTDDPVAPTTGTLVSASASGYWSHTTRTLPQRVTSSYYRQESLEASLVAVRRLWRGFTASAEAGSDAFLRQFAGGSDRNSAAWGDLYLGYVRIGSRNRQRLFGRITLVGTYLSASSGTQFWHHVRWPWNEGSLEIGSRGKWATVRLTFIWYRTQHP